MIIKFSKTFIKQRKKVSVKVQEMVDERIELFIENPADPLLNLHKLRGVLRKYHSINISGDWRAIIKNSREEVVVFMFLGTHSELYG